MSRSILTIDQGRWRMNESRLELRDPRSPRGVTGDPRGALKSKSKWTGEDNISRVKRDRCVRGLAEAGHALKSRESEGTCHEAKSWRQCVRSMHLQRVGPKCPCVASYLSSSIGVFSSFAMDLYIEGWLVGEGAFCPFWKPNFILEWASQVL